MAVDLALLAEKLFRVASGKQTIQRNRKALYALQVTL